MHIVIDSSTYRSDRKRVSAAFRAVTLLGSTGRITLHVPHYVYREFLSQQEEDLEKAVHQIKDGLANLTKLTNHDDVTTLEEVIRHQVENAEEEIVASTAEEFDDWIARSHAAIEPLPDDHAQRVTDAYFAGTSSFNAGKNRNDIPDAFIFEAIKDLAATHGQLHLIVADQNRRKACASLENVYTYETLDEFVTIPETQQLLVDASAAAAFARIKALLPDQATLLHGALETSIVEPLSGRKVHSRETPDDNAEGIVEMVDTPRDTGFVFQEVEYYGEGTVAIPFETRIECELGIFIFKADYYSIPDDRAAEISVRDWNDHYFKASETYDLDVTGRLIIQFPIEEWQRQDLTNADLQALIHDSDPTVEIETASVPND